MLCKNDRCWIQTLVNMSNIDHWDTYINFSCKYLPNVFTITGTGPICILWLEYVLLGGFFLLGRYGFPGGGASDSSCRGRRVWRWICCGWWSFYFGHITKQPFLCLCWVWSTTLHWLFLFFSFPTFSCKGNSMCKGTSPIFNQSP